MIEYRTLTYIMYKENLEREEKEKARQAEEAARKADEERKNKQMRRPTTLSQAREVARQRAMQQADYENGTSGRSLDSISDVAAEKLAEMIEDELL